MAVRAIPAERLDWKALLVNTGASLAVYGPFRSASVAPAPEMPAGNSALVQSMLVSRACPVHNGSATVIIFLRENFHGSLSRLDWRETGAEGACVRMSTARRVHYKHEITRKYSSNADGLHLANVNALTLWPLEV